MCVAPFWLSAILRAGLIHIYWESSILDLPRIRSAIVEIKVFYMCDYYNVQYSNSPKVDTKDHEFTHSF